MNQCPLPINQLLDVKREPVHAFGKVGLLSDMCQELDHTIGRLIPKTKYVGGGSLHFLDVHEDPTLQQEFKLMFGFNDMPLGQRQQALLIPHIPGQRNVDLDFGAGKPQ